MKYNNLVLIGLFLYIRTNINCMRKQTLMLVFCLGAVVAMAQTTPHDYIVSAQKKDSLNMFDAAIKDLDKAIELSKHMNDTALWLHSKISLERDDIKTAENDIDEVMHHSSKYAEAYFIRGLIKTKTENYAGAITDFNKSLKLNPLNAKAYYNRGLAHALIDELKQSIADFDKAIELNPDYAKAYFNRGYWKDVTGDVTGALADLLKAKQLNPADKEIYLELAVVYARNKKMKEACEELNNASAAGHQISEELKNEFCN